MSTALFDKLIHYWTLDEATGARRVDSVGGVDLINYHSSLMNPAGTGISDGCLTGNGVAGLISEGQIGLYKQPFTIGFWVKYAATPGADEFLLVHQGDADFTIRYASTGDIIVSTSVDGDLLAAPLVVGEWNLVLVQVEGSTIRLSLNGSAFSETTFAPATRFTQDFLYVTGTFSDFTGSLDELAIWQDALTAYDAGVLWADGLGLFPDEFQSEFSRRITAKTASIVTLVEVTAGITFKNWIQDSTYRDNGIMKVPCAAEISELLWNNELQTQADNQLHCQANPGSWFWDGAYLWFCPPYDETTGARRYALGKWFWWRQPQTVDVFSGVAIARAVLRLANLSKVLGDHYYEPRVDAIPDISLRIERRFGSISQSGGGTVTFVNADGFFDQMQDWNWTAGELTIKLGVDLPSSEMAYEDYKTVAVFGIREWSRTPKKFQLRVVERKDRFAAKLPLTTFDRTTYPNADRSIIGKPIPIGYGRIYSAPTYVIDVGARRFKVVGHAISEFTGVKIKQTREQKNTRTVAAGSWLQYSPVVYRYYLAGEEFRNVLFNGTSMTKVNSVADCASTQGSWTYEENFVYVRPRTGHTISSGTYDVETAIQIVSWTDTDFQTTARELGEFTLGTQWAPGIEVAVDFVGKLASDGFPMENGVDIVRDILQTVGHDSFDDDAFDEARARLLIGYDESARPVYESPVGLLLDDQKAAQDYVERVLAAVRGYVFTDANGRTSIGIFLPERSEGMRELTVADVIDLEEETLAYEATAVAIRYSPRHMEEWTEVYNLSSSQLQYQHLQSEPVVETRDLDVTRDSDVAVYAARYLQLDAPPVKAIKITTAWPGFDLLPGQQLSLNLPSLDLTLTAEVLEARLDFGAKRVELVLSDQRGLADSAGFWVDDAETLPVRFAGLAGYGSGSLDWNDDWDDEIKDWARRNVGYWTDENGFASSTDPDSYNTSNWI